jgi:hypothetical protein
VQKVRVRFNANTMATVPIKMVGIAEVPGMMGADIKIGHGIDAE